MNWVQSRRVWLVAALLLIGLEFHVMELGRGMDQQLSDQLTRHAAHQHPADPDIVLVTIDDASLNRLAPVLGRFPWPRGVYAELIELLSQFDPKAIVLDVLLTEPDALRPAQDRALAQTLAGCPSCYLPLLLLRNEREQVTAGFDLAALAPQLGLEAAGDHAGHPPMLLPVRELIQPGQVGAVNVPLDPDGLLRQYRRRWQAGAWWVPSLPWQVVKDWRPATASAARADDLVRLRWSAGTPGWASYGFATVYEGLINGQDEWSSRLTDKLIIVGATASGLNDFHHTPLGHHTPGMDVLATAARGWWRDDFYRTLDAPMLWSLNWALVLGALACAMLARRWLVSALLTAGLIAVTLIVMRQAFIGGWYLPLGHAVLLCCCVLVVDLMRRYLVTRQQRQAIRQHFGRFVHPEVVSQLMGMPDVRADARVGRRMPVTVMFSDIRGFTTFSETRSAQVVFNALNGYLERQTAVILRHGGTIDKFIGDGIMAFWGAPLPDAHQCEAAVAAACEMLAEAERFSQEWADELGEPFRIGVGLHQGEAIVGFLGSADRLDYTAIGDVVNLASRIEGLTKGLAPVLVSDAVRRQCDPTRRFTPMGAHAVKGRAEAVELYAPD